MATTHERRVAAQFGPRAQASVASLYDAIGADRFAVEADGSFTVDTMMIEAAA